MLESSAGARHAELVRLLNGHLAGLRRAVEGAVASALQVELAPVDVALELPSPLAFHSDVRQLVERGEQSVAVAVVAWIGCVHACGTCPHSFGQCLSAHAARCAILSARCPFMPCHRR